MRLIELTNEKMRNIGFSNIEQLIEELKCSKCGEIIYDTNITISAEISQKMSIFKDDVNKKTLYTLETQIHKGHKINSIYCGKCNQELTKKQITIYTLLNFYSDKRVHI